MREILPDTEPGTDPRRGGRAWYRHRALLAAPLTAAVAAGALALGTSSSGGGDDSPAGNPPQELTLASAIDNIALAAAESEVQVGPGQFIYVRSELLGEGDRSDPEGRAVEHEQWTSPDGETGWVNDGINGFALEDAVHFIPCAGLPGDEVCLSADEIPVSLAKPTHDFLTTVPTDSDALLARVYETVDELYPGVELDRDQEAFNILGGVISQGVLPEGLSQAVYQAAAEIPGVTVLEDAEDSLGREGIAIVRVDEASNEREEWLFDADSYEFLGLRIFVTEDTRGVPAGTLWWYKSITERAVVDEVRERP